MSGRIREGKTGLWRLTWSHAQGTYWSLMRICEPDSAESWKRVFESDDAQGVVYEISRTKPKISKGDETRARHMVTM